LTLFTEDTAPYRGKAPGFAFSMIAVIAMVNLLNGG